MFGFARIMWKELFGDLILFGKVLLFPIFAIFTILMFPIALIEFFTVDIMIFLFLLLSKNDSPKDFIDFIKEWWR